SGFVVLVVVAPSASPESLELPSAEEGPAPPPCEDLPAPPEPDDVPASLEPDDALASPDDWPCADSKELKVSLLNCEPTVAPAAGGEFAVALAWSEVVDVACSSAINGSVSSDPSLASVPRVWNVGK